MSTLRGPPSKEEQYIQRLYDECSEEYKLGSEVYDKPDKRTKDVIKEWDQYHMLVAILSARRSEDPNRQV